jgi:hypothetical protein
MKTRRCDEANASANYLPYPRFSLEITPQISPSIGRSEKLLAQSCAGGAVFALTPFVQSKCFEMSFSEIRGLSGINFIKIYPQVKAIKGRYSFNSYRRCSFGNILPFGCWRTTELWKSLRWLEKRNILWNSVEKAFTTKGEKIFKSVTDCTVNSSTLI